VIVAASTAGIDLLLPILIVLVAAKIGDEICKRIGQPTVIGEVVAGVIIGGTVLGLVEPTETIELFAELGVIFLLFGVGLHTRISEIRSVGRVAVMTGVLGLVFPAAGGIILGMSLDLPIATTAFLASALVATSVGITSAVLAQMGLISTKASRIILAAAVVDDILAMAALSIATGLADESASFLQISVSISVAVGLLVVLLVLGMKTFGKWPRLLQAPVFSESPLMPAVILCVAIAVLTAKVGLAGLIGAFLVGVVIAEGDDREAVEAEIAPFQALFLPFFFVLIGLQLDVAALATTSTALLATGLVVIGAVTKYLGAWLGARSIGQDARFVAVGMIPRGEVGIVIGSVGLAAGALTNSQFTAIVAMSLVTALFVPLIMRRMPRPA
jgi:Kef-type K+ transport system membrane component KefB